jgi:AraC family transcriptional regulator of adaptative response/methylated-DNA-[protein]-cysteine methyltransferase
MKTAKTIQITRKKRKADMQLSYQVFSSPIGEILVAGNAFAVTHVKWGKDKATLASNFMFAHTDVNSFDKTGYLREASSAILDFIRGKSSRIDVTIQTGGTDFQRKVWQKLREIPYGKTANYSAIAEAIDAPDAFRAVANACGDNPVPLIIPCHRVIHKNGDAGGFAWGNEVKQFLLTMEKERVGAAV